MREMVPIKVKIGLKPNGNAKYPDFNQLQIVENSELDWSYYVDVQGLGWEYDKTSGHRENTPSSPVGQQWGVLVIPEEFANQAIAMFPNDIESINETELEDFYNNKAHIYDDEETVDEKVLHSIKIKQDLEIELTPQQLKALDPNDDAPGLRKNKKKKWNDYKNLVDVQIKDIT